MILAADYDLFGFFGAWRCGPDLPVAYVGNDTLGRNFRRITCIYSFGIAANPGDAPHGLFRSGGIAGGIGKLSGSVLPFPSHVDDGIAIVGEIQLGERL